LFVPSLADLPRPDTCTLKTPHNVRLSFPNLGDDGLELWSRATLLKSASSYLRTLLESDFSEGTTKRSKRRRTTPGAASSTTGGTTSDEDCAASEDSDDEADEVLIASGPPALDSSDTSELEYCEIKITETAYSTYRALLTWLNTSHMPFAPLVSSFAPSSTPSRKDHLIARLSDEPSLPLPVSPKSIYRLAHLLDLPSLQQLALDNLKTQLTIKNIAEELFGDVAHVYDEVRAVELEFAMMNWAEVKKSQGFEEIRKKAKVEQAPYFGAIMAELVMGI
jgi:hypothetical protein